MEFNSDLYQVTLELASRLPKGSKRAQKALFRLWQSNPSWDPWLLNDDGIYRLFTSRDRGKRIPGGLKEKFIVPLQPISNTGRIGEWR